MRLERKRILLVWWYDRYDLIKPFIEIQEDIEFVCLFYRFKEQDSVEENFPFRRIYWTDYFSPQQLLKDIRPDKVVFMGIENLLTFALNNTAKNKGIPTYYLFHGIISNSIEERVQLHQYILENKLGVTDERYNIKNEYYTRKKSHSILFFMFTLVHFKTIRWYTRILKFILERSKDDNFTKVLKNNKMDFRLADYYLLLSMSTSNYFVERDGVDMNRMVFIGPYINDNIFMDAETERYNNISYVLLIDQNISTFDLNLKNEIIKALSKKFKSLNLYLYVKTHPADIDVDKIYLDDNIVHIKDNEDTANLIKNAKHVLGFDSALLWSAIVKNSVTCILIDETRTTALTWHKYNVVSLLPKEDILENKPYTFFTPKKEDIDHFVADYLTYADGKCTDRLKQLLLKD